MRPESASSRPKLSDNKIAVLYHSFLTGSSPLPKLSRFRHAAAFVENQVYSFSSTGQTYGIEARDIAKRIDRLIAATARLRNASILHRDFKDAMLYAAGEKTFYLLDPPYRGTEGCYPKGNFDEEQHKQLFRLASKIDEKYGGKCKFIITYNNQTAPRESVLQGFLNSLPREVQQEALGILTANLAGLNTTEKNN